jgi:uncharacterized RDD family membrane protein YckC/DNA-binding HxlR family transcriptional regulator
MALNQDNVSRILSVLSNSLRREILANLSEKAELSFTDLMNALSIDTGKLSFHLRALAGFLEQTPLGKYRLTSIGENAIRLIKELDAWATEVDIAKKASALPIASFEKRTIAFLIDFVVVFAVFAITAIVTNFFSLVIGGGTSRLDLNFILFLIIFWVYLTLLEGFAGQGLGKRIVGLKAMRVDGKRLSYEHAAVRNFGKVFLLPVDVVIGLRLKDKRYLRYFDKFAGTTVVGLRS